MGVDEFPSVDMPSSRDEAIGMIRDISGKADNSGSGTNWLPVVLIVLGVLILAAIIVLCVVLAGNKKRKNWQAVGPLNNGMPAGNVQNNGMTAGNVQYNYQNPGFVPPSDNNTLQR